MELSIRFCNFVKDRAKIIIQTIMKVVIITICKLITGIRVGVNK